MLQVLGCLIDNSVLRSCLPTLTLVVPAAVVKVCVGVSHLGVVRLYLCCRLAEAGPLAADELSMEYVPLYDFLGETTQLLDEVRHAAWWFWAV